MDLWLVMTLDSFLFLFHSFLHFVHLFLKHLHLVGVIFNWSWLFVFHLLELSINAAELCLIVLNQLSLSLFIDNLKLISLLSWSIWSSHESFLQLFLSTFPWFYLWIHFLYGVFKLFNFVSQMAQFLLFEIVFALKAL